MQGCRHSHTYASMWFTDAYDRLSKSQSNDTPAGQSCPPSRAPAEVASSEPNKSYNLIAFRTIMSLLSKVQQESQMSDKDVQMNEIELQKHMELKLLNALTTVLVMDHEVMVVIVNHSYPKMVEILACIQLDAPIQQVKTKTPRSLGLLWELLVSWNPRRGPDVHETSYDAPVPKICTPAIPDGLVSDDWNALLRYIDQRWSAYCNNITILHARTNIIGVTFRPVHTYISSVSSLSHRLPCWTCPPMSSLPAIERFFIGLIIRPFQCCIRTPWSAWTWQQLHFMHLPWKQSWQWLRAINYCCLCLHQVIGTVRLRVDKVLKYLE